MLREILVAKELKATTKPEESVNEKEQSQMKSKEVKKDEKAVPKNEAKTENTEVKENTSEKVTHEDMDDNSPSGSEGERNRKHLKV